MNCPYSCVKFFSTSRVFSSVSSPTSRSDTASGWMLNFTFDAGTESDVMLMSMCSTIRLFFCTQSSR